MAIGAMGAMGGKTDKPPNIDKLTSPEKKDSLPPLTEEEEMKFFELLPQVRLIALKIHERLPKSVGLDDLISIGTIGAVKAVRNFNPEKKIELKTYAEYKIRGAILDSLRNLDFASKHARKKIRNLEATREKLTKELGRNPDDQEIADAMGLSLEEFHKIVLDSISANPISLEVNPFNGDSASDFRQKEIPVRINPESIALEEETKRILWEVISNFPPQEKEVILGYFFLGMKTGEIAKKLHSHQTRVSQLKSQALVRLREALRTRGIDNIDTFLKK